MVDQDWQEVVAKKRASASRQIPAEWKLPDNITASIGEHSEQNVLEIPATCGILTSKELDITGNYTATELVAKIASKTLSSYEVTLAFCKRAAIAQQLTSCLTEMLFDRALERAKELDDYLATNGHPMGPLHGLPISLKDSFNITGAHSTIGYVSFIGNPVATSNSVLVDILLRNGAVLYVKTNIPQTMMTGDSHNNIFGRVLNPNKLCLGAGGSSGGEGALVRLRGSVLGIGTDIAGSVRFPASCCGNYGFTPSVARIPYGRKTNPTREGFALIHCVAGPLTTDAHDLRLLMEAVIRSSPWDLDPDALAVPWRQPERKQHLTIGVLYECPTFPVTPPMVRATKTAVGKLRDAGHKIIELTKFPSFMEATDVAFESFDIDNAMTTFTHISKSGEPQVPSVAGMYPASSGGRRDRMLDDLYELGQRRHKLRSEWLEIFVQNQLDVLVTPAAHSTAVAHDKFRHPAYTVMWNLVSSPACVIPYLHADRSIDVADSRLPSYDPEVVHGAPCSVQVVGRAYQDEELINAVETIAAALQE